MRYLLITDPPTPWREPVFELVHRALGDDFHVVYFGLKEKRRLWSFSIGAHQKSILNSISINFRRRGERYINLGIVPFLVRHRPKIGICFGIYPTSFISYFLLKLFGSKIIVFADTWLGRDGALSLDQKLARHVIYGHFGRAYIGASVQTLRMFKHYNPRIKDRAMFLSGLCANNDYFKHRLSEVHMNKRYDLLFCGRIVKTKNPLFFSEVAGIVRQRRGDCSVLIVGDGEDDIKREWFNHMKTAGVTVRFVGFVQHEQLPEYYAQARLMLLPTLGDCWGVVINEAFISGVPVITTDRTAAAGELVVDGRNGYVLPLDPVVWADRVCALLSDPELLNDFSSRAREDVERFNFKTAARGIIDAIHYVEDLTTK
jgi:glycosyltransferase involved in cell wall biosynthesis